MTSVSFYFQTLMLQHRACKPDIMTAHRRHTAVNFLHFNLCSTIYHKSDRVGRRESRDLHLDRKYNYLCHFYLHPFQSSFVSSTNHPTTLPFHPRHHRDKLLPAPLPGMFHLYSSQLTENGLLFRSNKKLYKFCRKLFN